MSGHSLAPGSRALAAALLIGLVGVLIGRAIWGEDGVPVRPATTQAGAATGTPSEADPAQANSLNSVMTRSAAGLGACLNDVSGPAAPAADQDAENQEQFITILSGQLETLRGLGFDHPVKADFLSSPQIEKRIRELVGKEPQPTEASKAGTDLLAALGAIKPSDDPAKIQEQALEGQVAGLYVPETGELLVRSGKSINITDTITVVHELDHALTDQALGGIKEKFGGGPSSGEQQSAYTALVEGDATITMEAYLLRHGGFSDQVDALNELGPATKAQDELENSTPYYFQRELLFPYLDGLRFDCHLYEQGGWKAVNRAYHDPPKTTAEVMFPERYGEKVPRVPATTKLNPGWKRELTTEVGAADLEWLFAAPGGDLSKGISDPRAAAGAWDGGRAEVWANDGQTAFSMILNERSGAPNLCDSVRRWYGAFGGVAQEDAYPEPELTSVIFDGKRNQAKLTCSNGVVRLGIGPTANIAAGLAYGDFYAQHPGG